MRRREFLSAATILSGAALAGCGRCEETGAGGPVELVFAHGKHPRYLFLSGLIRQFEAEHPGVRVREVVLPSSSDEMHQFYVINLAAGAADFDILDMDVIWVPEFARAGWLEELTPHVTDAELTPLHAGARRADWLDGKLFGVPWFVDAGVLYYRKDLLEAHGLGAPQTYSELLEQAQSILASAREERLYGFVWQGKQYEGLVCAALEFIRGNGGDILGPDGEVTLEKRETLAALEFMNGLIRKYDVTPELVTTLDEEASRHIFQSGRAVFMRNWPYAWRLLGLEDSPVAGRVGLTIVPHFDGHASAPTLGGWHLGVSARSRYKREAIEFLRFFIRYSSQKEVLLKVGVLAAHQQIYQDPEVRAVLPHLPELLPALEAAEPRPVSPYYLMISQMVQPELSAVVAGIRSPARAMEIAAQQVEHLLRTAQAGAKA